MEKKSFVEGTIIATVAIVIVKILGMLYVIPFYAMIGIIGGALYAYAYNIYIIFLNMSTAGIPIAMSKITSEYNALGRMDAKERAFKIGKKIISRLSVIFFVVLFVFARLIAELLVGSLDGGNSVADVSFVIRVISFAILVLPRLGVLRGYLQGHKFIAPPSISQIIEQIVRIVVILLGTYAALNVLMAPVTSAVSIALFGAILGGGVAYLYVVNKMKKNKEALSLNKQVKSDQISDKEIRKKIIKYAIPFIIVGLHMNIYNFTNMVLILRTLDFLNFTTENVEFIASAITTFAPKLNMIVIALASGMGINLIPAITAAFNLNDWREVNAKLNKALQIIVLVALPMTILISLLAVPIWTMFYGFHPYGGAILALNIFIAFVGSLFMIVVNTLQGLNKFKTLYLAVLFGFGLNVLLIVPLMLLFNSIGIYAFYGSILATLLGYAMTVVLVLRALKKDHPINYKETKERLKEMVLPVLFILVLVGGIGIFFPYVHVSRYGAVLYTVVVGLIGAISYLIIAYKMNIFNKVFGDELVRKVMKKLAFWQA